MKEAVEHCRTLRILVINISISEKYYSVQLMYCLAHAGKHFVMLNSEVLPYSGVPVVLGFHNHLLQ
jgi:hypothetical protein